MGLSFLLSTSSFNYGIASRRFSMALLLLVLAVHVGWLLAFYLRTVAKHAPIERPILITLITNAATQPKIQAMPQQSTKPKSSPTLPHPQTNENQTKPLQPSVPEVPQHTLVAETPAQNSAVGSEQKQVTESTASTNQPSESVFKEASQSIEMPRFDADYLDNPSPTYPSLSKRKGEEGRVMLRVFVESNGLPTQIQLHKSSGFPRLDEAALETLRHWKFVPARQGGQAIGAWVIVPIQFNLKG